MYRCVFLSYVTIIFFDFYVIENSIKVSINYKEFVLAYFDQVFETITICIFLLLFSVISYNPCKESKEKKKEIFEIYFCAIKSAL